MAKRDARVAQAQEVVRRFLDLWEEQSGAETSPLIGALLVQSLLMPGVRYSPNVADQRLG